MIGCNELVYFSQTAPLDRNRKRIKLKASFLGGSTNNNLYSYHKMAVSSTEMPQLACLEAAMDHEQNREQAHKKEIKSQQFSHPPL